jgi:hypothetical protein
MSKNELMSSTARTQLDSFDGYDDEIEGELRRRGAF